MATLSTCNNGNPFACFPVVNHVLTWPDLRERFDTSSRGFKRSRPLYEMKLSIVEDIAEYFEDAERQAHAAIYWKPLS
ncbi:MAG: hypothetical protein DMG38_26130 [Acidobacteria bacterium]|nr:MAG: hypothetical protein DMG38_26130 [Acidobacteriota bacterium]